jgi:hypothetical protein
MSWLELLSQAVAQSSRTEVADRLGYSRTAISLVLSGQYMAKTDRLAQRVVAVYQQVPCPHLCISLSHKECTHYRTRHAPTSSPSALRHWRACQSCTIPHEFELHKKGETA